MKERDIYMLQLDCSNRVNEEYYEYPDQEKLSEIISSLSDSKETLWIEYALGELLAHVKTVISPIKFEFTNALCERYFKKIFKFVESDPCQVIDTLVLNEPENCTLFKLYSPLYDKILIISPKFDVVDVIDKTKWDITTNMYSLELSKKTSNNIIQENSEAVEKLVTDKPKRFSIEDYRPEDATLTPSGVF